MQLDAPSYLLQVAKGVNMQRTPVAVDFLQT